MNIIPITSFTSQSGRNKAETEKRAAYEKALDEELIKSLDLFESGDADALFIQSSVKKEKNGKYKADLVSTVVKLTEDIRLNDDMRKKDTYEKQWDEAVAKSLHSFETGESNAIYYVDKSVKRQKDGNHESESITGAEKSKKGFWEKITEKFKKNNQ